MKTIVDLKWISVIVKHMWKIFTAVAAFIEKFFGLNWDTGADDFIFDFENISRTAEKLDITKRNNLRVAAMFFDPLGLISPLTLQPKLIFQELCRNKLEWEEVINDRNNINKWTNLGQFRLINAPRHVLCCEIGDVELHWFSSSSRKAYGACVFVRVSCEHGGSVRLWTSKCRLAPVKELSIPWLELMAGLLLSRLMVSVKLAVEKEVSIKNSFCQTDLQIALWWIRQRCKEWKI